MNETNIYREEQYYDCLSKGMFDKAWFLDKLEPEIDTLVDFGCGDGSLRLVAERVYPGRFRYIGIDTNEEMRRAAQENGAEVCSCLEELPDIDYGRAALVLNSVIHEIFSFAPFNEAYNLFEAMAGRQFRHIAIRDMCLNKKDKLTNYTKEIMESRFARQFEEFMESTPDSIYPDVADYKVMALEFLLKYNYTQDWSQGGAVYLWRWHSHIPEIFSQYTKEYDSTFRVPYFIRLIRKDFGIDLQFDTHRKMLLTKI